MDTGFSNDRTNSLWIIRRPGSRDKLEGLHYVSVIRPTGLLGNHSVLKSRDTILIWFFPDLVIGIVSPD